MMDETEENGTPFQKEPDGVRIQANPVEEEQAASYDAEAPGAENPASGAETPVDTSFRQRFSRISKALRDFWNGGCENEEIRKGAQWVGRGYALFEHSRFADWLLAAFSWSALLCAAWVYLVLWGLHLTKIQDYYSTVQNMVTGLFFLLQAPILVLTVGYWVSRVRRLRRRQDGAVAFVPQVLRVLRIAGEANCIFTALSSVLVLVLCVFSPAAVCRFPVLWLATPMQLFFYSDSPNIFHGVAAALFLFSSGIFWLMGLAMLSELFQLVLDVARKLGVRQE